MVRYITINNSFCTSMPEAPPPPYTANRVRKNMDMDATKLAAAKRVLGAGSDTETVDRALDYVLFQSSVESALDALAAAGGLDDPFEAPLRRRVAEQKPRTGTGRKRS
jgi:hypothetical protein